MEIKKCSGMEHSEINAVIFCQECKLYMCNKCEKMHSGLCFKHHTYKLDKEVNEIFTGFCKEENHNDELEFYCKTHNQLCCAACISKIKIKGKGQHTDCDVYYIQDIKQEKKIKLKENIEILEFLSNTFEESFNQMKIIFEKINENKEKLKNQIQKIFTDIRNAINDREDEILLKVNKEFEKLSPNEDILKEGEKLPNKIKISLEKGKLIENEWNDNKDLNILINDCINIENNIKKINIIKDKIIKYTNKDYNIQFYAENSEFIKNIKKFGEIRNFSFNFKECPKNINKEREFRVDGEKHNILTKTGIDSYFSGTICENQLEESKIYKWKIKILKTEDYNIFVGVAPNTFNCNCPMPNKSGYYYCCKDGYLDSGPPFNYNSKNINLNKKKNEVIIVMDMNKKSLKFIINNEDKGDSYIDIPVINPLFPSVILKNLNDSVEIINL